MRGGGPHAPDQDNRSEDPEQATDRAPQHQLGGVFAPSDNERTQESGEDHEKGAASGQPLGAAGCGPHDGANGEQFDGEQGHRD